MSSPHTITPSPEDQALKARFQERREVLNNTPTRSTQPSTQPSADFHRAWRSAQALNEARAHQSNTAWPSWGYTTLSLSALCLLAIFILGGDQLSFSSSPSPTPSPSFNQRALHTLSASEEGAEEAWLEPLAWGTGWLEGEEWAPQWPPSTL